MKFESKEDFLVCLRNELVPENPKTGFGVIGLLDYRINQSKKMNYVSFKNPILFRNGEFGVVKVSLLRRMVKLKNMN